jgi:hypothetical protein
MAHSWWSVISPITGLLLNVVVQITGHRLVTSLALLRSVYLGFGVGLLGMLFFETQIYMAGYFVSKVDALAVVFSNVTIYSCLGYCYFSMIGMGEHARRIRMLKELNSSPEGLSLKEMLNRYNAKIMIELRIGRLIRSGQVLEKGDRYFIGKPVMLFFTNLTLIAKKYILGRSSAIE